MVLCLNFQSFILCELITIICLWHLSWRTAVLYDWVEKFGNFYVKQILINKAVWFLIYLLAEWRNLEIVNFAKQEVVSEHLRICTESCICSLRIWRKRTTKQILDNGGVSEVSQCKKSRVDGENEGKPSAILTSPLEITNVFKTVLGFKVTIADYKGDTLLWLRRYFIRL